ncbi:hypothetical protein DFJ58DRAFT_725187 [Suillus subalutaceus]|uniref:uncharacterized protein n=1 Tax=Suillus subalutaceus TaxID=48586 RepID=UPI001B8708EF|nr:uncharacterized protein DFJ58DRAFT_725187 [Suillus subalutaceus]KAG1863285.1 hypothetical protein DFJ58DRAFT_725187 [Suillus subalutaceus]
MQNDTFSCGIVTANTIAHGALGDELWEPKKRSSAHAMWFITLAKEYLNNHQLTNMNEDVPMDEDDLPDIVLESSIQAEKLPKKPDTHISGPALQSHEPTASSKVLAAESTDTRVHNAVEAYLSRGSLLSWLKQVPTVGDKRPLSKADLGSKDRSGGKVAKKAKVVKLQSGPAVGISRSATASRDLRMAARSGTSEPCPRKKATWKTKILELDKDAIADDDCQTVHHSNCGRTMKNKEPYDVSRFREHVMKKCAQQKPTPTAGMPSRMCYLLRNCKSGSWIKHHQDLNSCSLWPGYSQHSGPKARLEDIP